MRYTLESGKVVNIPDKEIKKNMELLEISENEAVQLWLEDNDYETNEEQEELDKKAKSVKIQHEAKSNTTRKPATPRTVKVSDEKMTLFSEIFSNLEDIYKNNVKILKENKLIEVKIREKTFKVDIIEQRPKKA